MPTALHRNSKSDTVLLLDDAGDDIFIDLGPARTNLADNTTYISETASARAAISAPRNVAVVCDMSSDDAGTLLQLGNVAVYSYRITVASDCVVTVWEAGAAVASVAMPEPSKSAVLALVHWSTRVEGSSVVSELAVYNFDVGLWAFATATHAASTPDPAHHLTIGAAASGASAYGIGKIHAVHLGRRFHATTEAREDWVGFSSPPAFDGRDRTPLLTGAATDLEIAGEGNFAGPSMLWAGAATRQAAQRCVGPFVNARPLLPATEYVTGSPVHFYRATPDGAAGWQWCVRYLWHGYLSPKVNVAQVRAHLRCFDIFGNEVISPVRFRSFSIADLPVGAPGPAMTYYRGPIVSAAVPVNGWHDLGVVRLARSTSGLSYFALGFFVDATEDEGAEYSTVWQLNALTVDPYAKEIESGGFGDVEDKAGP
jgi:hypothetical protein